MSEQSLEYQFGDQTDEDSAALERDAAQGLATLFTPYQHVSFETTLQIPSAFIYSTHPDPEVVLNSMLGAGSFTDQTHEQCAYILQHIDRVSSLERCNCLSEGQKSSRFQKDRMNAWIYNPTKRKHSDDKEWIGPVLIVTAPSTNKKESKRRGLHFGGRQFKVKNFESVIVTHGEDRTEGLIGRKYQLYRPRLAPPVILHPSIEFDQNIKRIKTEGDQDTDDVEVVRIKSKIRDELEGMDAKEKMRLLAEVYEDLNRASKVPPMSSDVSSSSSSSPSSQYQVSSFTEHSTTAPPPIERSFTTVTMGTEPRPHQDRQMNSLTDSSLVQKSPPLSAKQFLAPTRTPPMSQSPMNQSNTMSQSPIQPPTVHQPMSQTNRNFINLPRPALSLNTVPPPNPRVLPPSALGVPTLHPSYATQSPLVSSIPMTSITSTSINPTSAGFSNQSANNQNIRLKTETLSPQPTNGVVPDQTAPLTTPATLV